MKKVTLFLLMIVAGTGNLSAQTPMPEKPFFQRVEEYKALNKTERTFRMGPSYQIRKFSFDLRYGHRLIFNFQNIRQALQVPDVDSLLQFVWNALQPFSDSFSKPLVNRRIDFNIGLTSNMVRFLEYQPASQVFRVTPADTAQLKMEQDTLTISLFTEAEPVLGRPGYQPYYITLLLNNITDLPLIQKEDLDWAIKIMQEDVTAMLAKSKKAEYEPVTAVYNAWDKKRIQNTQLNKKHRFFIPYVQGSFQYIRGGWSPSVGLGMEYSWRQNELHTLHTRLLWEPYFFFTRADDKKTEIDRADFITMVFHDRMLEEKGSWELDYSLQFTLGYAVRTRGTWFEKNTFKFSLPGFEYQNIMLYPEFNFHHFFKDFNPSMKLVMNFE